MSERLVDIAVHEFDLPLRRPLSTSRGAVDTRSVAILRVETRQGVVGLGEASVPHWLGGSENDYAAMLRALRDHAGTLLARRADAGALASDVFDAGLPAPVRSAFTSAGCDIAARVRGQSMARYLGASSGEALFVSALVGTTDVDEAVRVASEAVRRGFRCLKLKVGVQAIEVEARLVAAVRDAVGGATAIRLDANGAWDLENARLAIDALAPFSIEMIEEPLRLPNPHRLADLRASVAVPIAVDESVRDREDLERYLDADAIDAVVLKLLRVGGPYPALELGRLASLAGVRTVFTDSIETSVGMRAVAHTAAAAATTAPIGLGGALCLAADIVGAGAVACAPTVAVAGLGLGVELAP